MLVVDDEPIMLRTIRRLINRSHPDWELVTVLSGEDAIATLGRKHFDVMVTDLRMIGMQGRTLLELVRFHHPRVVRVIHSAHVDSLPPGLDPPLAHRAVTKPASGEELIGAIEWALEVAAERSNGDNSACS